MRSVGTLAVLAAVGWAACGQVAINEVAWGGTNASPYHEWVELVNLSDQAVDLTGWTLTWEGVTIPLGEESGAVVLLRRTTIEPHGFFLLERSRDDTVVGREADLIYTGALVNRGDVVSLLDPTGKVVDTANRGCAEGWWAGAPGVSMERVAPHFPDGRFAWRDGTAGELIDAKGNPIVGSPGSENAAYSSSPRVELAPPQGRDGRVWVVEWQAVDPDNPAQELTVQLNLSRDGGKTWTPLAESLPPAGLYEWDAATEEPGAVLLAAVATDPQGNWGAAWQELRLPQ
ncbi:MAG: lamin tail domain-containing protein [Candidatus Bipolaricaulaceae bacterium]